LRPRGLARVVTLSLSFLLIILSALPIALFIHELITVPVAQYRLNIGMLNPSYTSSLRVMGRAALLYEDRVPRPRAAEIASKPNSTFILQASCGDLTSYAPLGEEEFEYTNPITTGNRTVYLEMRISKVVPVLVHRSREEERVSFFIVSNETTAPICSKVRTPSPLPTPDRMVIDPVFEGKAFQVNKLLSFAETYPHTAYSSTWTPSNSFPSGYSVNGTVRLSASSLSTLTETPFQDPCSSGWTGTNWSQNVAVDGRDILKHEIGGSTTTSDQTDSVYKEFSIPAYDPSLISDMVLCWDHRRADSLYTGADQLGNRGETFPSASWGLHKYNLGGDSNADIYYEGQTASYFNVYLIYSSSSAYTDYSVGRTHGGLSVDLSGGKVAVFGTALLYQGGGSNSGGEDAFYISFGFARGGTNYWIVYVWKIKQDLDPAFWFMKDSSDTKWVTMGTGAGGAQFNLNGRNICDDIRNKFGWSDTNGCTLFEVKCDSRSKPQQNFFPCLINARFDHIHIIPYSETQGAEVVYAQSAGGGTTYASSTFHASGAGNEEWTTHSLTIPASRWADVCGSTIRVRLDATHRAHQFECDQDDGANGITAGNGRAGNSVNRFYYDNICLKVTFNKAKLTLSEQPSWTIVWTPQNASTLADRQYKTGPVQVRGCTASLRVEGMLESPMYTTSHTIQIEAAGALPRHTVEVNLDSPSGGSGYSNYRADLTGLPTDYLNHPITVLCPEPGLHNVSSSCTVDSQAGKISIPTSVFSAHGFGRYTIKLLSPNYVTQVKTQWSSNSIYYDEDYFNPDELKHASITIRSAIPGTLAWQINGSYGSSPENTLQISSTSHRFDTTIGDTPGRWTIGVKYLSSDKTEAGFEAHNYYVTGLRLDWAAHEGGATDPSSDPWWTNNAATVYITTHVSWSHSPSTSVDAATVKAYDNTVEISSATTQTSGNATISCGPFIDTQKTITIKPVTAPSPMCSRHLIASQANTQSKSMIWTGLKIILQRIDGLSDASGDVCWTNNRATVTPTVSLVWTHASPPTQATGAVVSVYSNNTHVRDLSDQSGVITVPTTHEDTCRLIRIQPLRSDHGITYQGGGWNRSIVWTGLRVAVIDREGLTDTSSADWWTNNNNQVTLRVNLLWSHNSRPASGGVITLLSDQLPKKDYTVPTGADSSYVLSDSNLRHTNSARNLRVSPKQADHGIVYNSGEWNQTIIWTGLKVWLDSQLGARDDGELWANNNARVTLTYHLTWTHNQMEATGGIARIRLDSFELANSTVPSGQPCRFQANLTRSNARHLVELSPIKSDHGITFAAENWSRPIVWTGLTCSLYGSSGATDTAQNTWWTNNNSPVAVRALVKYSHDASPATNVVVRIRCDSQLLTTVRNLTGGIVTTPALTYADTIRTFNFEPLSADHDITCNTGNLTVGIIWTGIRLLVDAVDGHSDESETDLWVPDNIQITLSVRLVWSYNGQNATGGTLSLFKDGVWAKDLTTAKSSPAVWTVAESFLRGRAVRSLIQLMPRAADHDITHNSGGWSRRVTWTSVVLSLTRDQKTQFDDVWTDLESAVSISVYARYLYDPGGAESPTLQEPVNCSVTDGVKVERSSRGTFNFSYTNPALQETRSATVTFVVERDHSHNLPTQSQASLNITWTGLGVALTSWKGLTDATSEDLWANDNDQVELTFTVHWLHAKQTPIPEARMRLTTSGTDVWLSPKVADGNGVASFTGSWSLSKKRLQAYADQAVNPKRGVQGSGPDHISHYERWERSVTWAEIALSLSPDLQQATAEFWTDIGATISVSVHGWYRYDPQGGVSPRLNERLSGEVGDGHSTATSASGSFLFTYREAQPTETWEEYTPTSKNTHGITKHKTSTAKLVWTSLSIGSLEVDSSNPRLSIVEVPVAWSHNGSLVPGAKVEVAELGLTNTTGAAGRAKFAFPDGQNYTGSLTFTAVSGPMGITRCLERRVLERHRLTSTLTSVSQTLSGLNVTLDFSYETGRPAEDVEVVLGLTPVNVTLRSQTVDGGRISLACPCVISGNVSATIVDARYLGKQVIVDESTVRGMRLFDDRVGVVIEALSLPEHHSTGGNLTVTLTLRSLAATVKLGGVEIHSLMKGGNETSVHAPHPSPMGDLEPLATVVRSIRLLTVPKSLPTGNYTLVLTVKCGNATLSAPESRTIRVQKLVSLVVKVRDSLGTAMPGATVKVTLMGKTGNLTAQLILTTDQDGKAVFQLPVGQYRVEVSSTGSTQYEKVLDLAEDLVQAVSLQPDLDRMQSGQSQIQLFLAVAVSILSSILILSRRRQRR